MEIMTEKTKITLKRENFNACASVEEMCDYVVPDTYPDIERVVYSCGEILIGGKTVNDGKITVEGVVKCTVLYVSDGEMEELVKICNDIPYIINFEAENVNSMTDIVAKIKLIALEVKVLNPRKVLLKSEVGATVRCFNEEEIEITSNIPQVKGLHVKKSYEECAIFTEVKEKIFSLSEEISPPPSPEGYEQILCADSVAKVDDFKFVGNKLIFKGEIQMHIMARPRGTRLPISFTTSHNFSQIIEISKYEEKICPEIVLCMTGSEFKIEEHETGKQVITTEINLLAQVIISENVEVSYVEDAYCNRESYSIIDEKITLAKSRESETLRDTFRCTLQVERQVSEIICVKAMSKTTVSDIGAINANIVLSMIYMSADGKIYSLEEEQKFFIDTEICAENYVIEFCLGEIYAVAAGEGIDLRIPYEAEIIKSDFVEISMVKSLELEESECRCDKPSIVVIPKIDDINLWKLAKKYASTTELIEKYNSENCDVIIIPVENM